LAFFAVIFVHQAVLAQVPMAMAAPGPAYRINAGDELEVLVWGDDRLQRDVRVLPDGTFAFPLIGQVRAAGELPSVLAQTIWRALAPQYRGPVPQVTVTVKSPSGYQFSVIGKVKSPGTFTPGRYVNALEAITAAGGPTEFADINGITVVRKSGERLQTLKLRLGRILKGEASSVSESDVPFIQSGDTIVVP
jgi:polysaccharide export outer membrane protein